MGRASRGGTSLEILKLGTRCGERKGELRSAYRARFRSIHCLPIAEPPPRRTYFWIYRGRLGELGKKAEILGDFEVGQAGARELAQFIFGGRRRTW